MMDRFRLLFASSKARVDEYQPLAEDESAALEEPRSEAQAPFSWLEYSIFALIGVAMLWAWNMFLAAAPYFQTRFRSDPWILANSQSAILTVFTVVNLAAMLILTNMQSSASYAFRINIALLLNAAVFVLLTLSTASFLDVSVGAYLAFILLMVALAAWAAGLMQNGAFAFAAGFGRTEYTQAVMAGQGVAGILPPLTQMLSYLAFSDPSPSPSAGAPARAPDQPSEGSPSTPDPAAPPHTGGTAAFIYFLTAVLISLATLFAFIPLVRRHSRNRSLRAQRPELSIAQASPSTPRRHVALRTLLAKLRWLAASVSLCFAIAMFFPVFTAKIFSVHDPSTSHSNTPSSSSNDNNNNSIFTPGAFISLGFFTWNLGDLLGRVASALPSLTAPRRRPLALFAIALARVAFLPLYLLCNLHGRGAVVPSDAFYLLAVQLPFGLTNGWLGASAMMAAAEWVAEGEREAAGGFMGLCLVAGLAVGSMLSFGVAGV